MMRPDEWVLALDVPDDALSDYELIEENKGYREWCVPAAVLNQVPIVESADRNDERFDAVINARWGVP